MPSEPSPTEHSTGDEDSSIHSNPSTDGSNLAESLEASAPESEADSTEGDDEEYTVRSYRRPVGQPLPEENPFTHRMLTLAREYIERGKVIRLHSSSNQYLGVVSGVTMCDVRN